MDLNDNKKGKIHLFFLRRARDVDHLDDDLRWHETKRGPGIKLWQNLPTVVQHIMFDGAAGLQKVKSHPFVPFFHLQAIERETDIQLERHKDQQRGNQQMPVKKHKT